jgi:DNA-binding beta-propeller fold protein YncE
MITLLAFALALQGPTRPTLVVVNQAASTVSVIDLVAGKTLATLPTGHFPHEVAVSTGGRWAVVTDYGDRAVGSTLTVVDLQTLTVARTIDLAPRTRPHSAAFLPDQHTLAVTCETNSTILLVDIPSGAVTGQAPTGQRLSHMMALNADGRHVYTANMADGSVSQIDLTGKEATRFLPVSVKTEAIGLNATGTQTWLGSNETGKVYAVDLAGWKVVDSLQTSGMPYRIGFNPTGTVAMVTNPTADEIRFFDPATRQLLGVLNVGGGAKPSEPVGLTFSPDGTTAWVTLQGTSEAAEIDLATRTIRRRLATGQGPDGIAYVER